MASLATRPELHKGPVGSLRDRCALCSVSRPKLLLCTGCRAVRYCSREHQVEDRPAHKTDCNGIKKERARVEKEDHLIRNQQGDFMTPANAFETHVGHFYGILETRVYIRARFILADHLRLMGTPDGVREAADHIQDMLRLNRSDNLGQRDFLPAILLRLDRDQEAYDFIKWWATTGNDSNYDWGNTDLPHLNLKDEDVLESPSFACRKFPNLSHLAAMFLLKLKLIIDIRSIKAARWVLRHNSPLPAELQLAIEPDVVRSPISLKRFVGKPTKDLNAAEIKLCKQARSLGSAMTNANDNYVSMLFDPDKYLVIHPEAYSMGSPEHAALALQQNFSSMWQTAGAFELLNDACQCAGRDAKDEMASMLKRIKKMEERYRPTPAELFEDVSRQRMWIYLDWAVQNASYLGRWSDRPSERYSEAARARVMKYRAEGKITDEEMEWTDTDESVSE